MNEIFARLAPVLLILPLGYLLKQIKVLTKPDADLFMKVVFYITFPPLLFLSINQIELSAQMFLLPLSGATIIFIEYGAATLLTRWLKPDKTTKGVMLIGAMIMNIGFTIPFVVSAYGHQGLGILTIFDFSNAFLTYTLMYYVAHKHGTGVLDKKILVRKFVQSPPIWALLIAVSFNLLKVPIPTVVHDYFKLLGDVTTPLLLLALGVYFQPRIILPRYVFLTLLLRVGLGFAIGFSLVELFDIQGISRQIVLLGASAPVGFNTLIFSSLENLNKEFAAGLVSVSILLGLITATGLILFFHGS